MSFFETIELLPDDPIMSIAALYKENKKEKKVNLGIGAYQDTNGLPLVLNCVKKAENILAENIISKEYLPIAGDANYISECLKLVYGEDSPLIAHNEVFAAQAVGGSGALRVGAEFLAKECSNKIFISDPSWPNHKGIFTQAGLKVETYTYYNEKKRELDFEGLCQSIKKISPGSIVLFQPCCHNPTGVDLTFQQWQILSELTKSLKLFPFFDLAYQGFGESLEEDVKPIRYFIEQGHQLMVAQSFSKNFGLYGERAGILSIVTRQSESAKRVGSKIKHIIRESYSNPPLHGAKIISTILQDHNLRNQWELELNQMKLRIREMRESLVEGLMEKCPRHDFSFLRHQRGMFSFSGLNQHQVIRLRDEFGIYIVWNGRINVAGLNSNNLDYVINSIKVVL